MIFKCECAYNVYEANGRMRNYFFKSLLSAPISNVCQPQLNSIAGLAVHCLGFYRLGQRFDIYLPFLTFVHATPPLLPLFVGDNDHENHSQNKSV